MIIVLRILHVVLAIFWGGSIIFLNMFVGPAAEAAGPAGFAFMRALSRRRHIDVMLTVGAIVILSGIELTRRDSSNFDPSWFRTGFGMAIATGMVVTFIGYLIALLGIKPTLGRIGHLAADMEQAPVDQRGGIMAALNATRSRMIMFSATGMACLVIAMIAMAVARYV